MKEMKRLKHLKRLKRLERMGQMGRTAGIGDLISGILSHWQLLIGPS